MSETGFQGFPQVASLKVFVDIVYVIDGTGSMQKLLDAVKDNALTMYDKIVEGLSGSRLVQNMRIRVIVYRDIYVDTEAIVDSGDFFTLPAEAQKLRDFISGIQAMGGGDEPESGLEALHFAIQSPWKQPAGNVKKVRHIVVVMTDASAHKLDDPQRFIDPAHVYPPGVPDRLKGVEAEWLDLQGQLNQRGKRLILFTPNSYPWSEVIDWGNAIFETMKPDGTLDEAAYQSVLAMIIKSI